MAKIPIHLQRNFTYAQRRALRDSEATAGGMVIRSNTTSGGGGGAQQEAPADVGNPALMAVNEPPFVVPPRDNPIRRRRR